MTHGNRNPGASRRDALQTMIGIGAGLATAESLIPANSSGAASGTSIPFLSTRGASPSVAPGSSPAGFAGIYDVRGFGARGDGKTVDTKTLRVKPGTKHGSVQRLRGEGPPKLGGSGQGDIHYRFTIDVPEELDAKQQEAVEALSQVMNGNPRARLYAQAPRSAGGEAR